MSFTWQVGLLRGPAEWSRLRALRVGISRLDLHKILCPGLTAAAELLLSRPALARFPRTTPAQVQPSPLQSGPRQLQGRCSVEGPPWPGPSWDREANAPSGRADCQSIFFPAILGCLTSLRKDKVLGHTSFLISFCHTSSSVMMFCFPFIAIKNFFFSFWVTIEFEGNEFWSRL